MLAVAYGGQFVTTRVRGVARVSHRLQQGFGLLIIVFALAMYFQYDTLITVWAFGLYPLANSACERRDTMRLQPMIGAFLFAALCVTGLFTLGHGADDAKAGARATLTSTHAGAPNFVGVKAWLNSGPLNIADLRGKVVLVDFLTYGCYNCVNTLPQVTRLYKCLPTGHIFALGCLSCLAEMQAVTKLRR